MTRRKKILSIFIILLIAVCGLFLAAYLVFTPERIGSMVARTLSRELKCDVQIGKVDVFAGGVVFIDDVRLRLPGRADERGFLNIKRIVVDGSPLRLLTGIGGINEVEINGPRLVVGADMLEFLAALSGDGVDDPERPSVLPERVVISGGSVVIERNLLYVGSPLLEVGNINGAMQARSFSAQQFTVDLAARHLLLGTIRAEAEIDLLSETLTARAVLPALVIRDATRSLLPEEALDTFDLLHFRGLVRPEIELAASWKNGEISFQPKLIAHAEDCTMRVRDVPIPITQVHGTVESDGTRLIIRNGVGRYKDGTIQIIRGLVDDKVTEMEAVMRNIPIDSELVNALPKDAQDVVAEFGLDGGKADASYRLRSHKRGKRIYPEHTLNLDVRNMRALYKDFPYPVDRLAGNLLWESPRELAGTPGRVSVNLQALADVGALNIVGMLELSTRTIPAPRPERPRPDLTVTAQRIELDAALRHALPPDVREVMDSLHMRGNADATVMLSFHHADGILSVTNRRIVFNLNGVQLTPDAFPYPIENLSGRVELLNDRLRIIDVRGKTGTAKVTISGEIALNQSPSRSRQPDTAPNLTITVDGIQFDEALRQSLGSELREVWYTLWPKGTANITTKLSLRPEIGQAEVRHISIKLQHCGIQYNDFPYPVDGLTGLIEIVPQDSVRMIGMRGYAGEARVDISGEIDLRPDELKQNEPQNKNVFVRVEGLALDANLRHALSLDMKAMWDNFKPSGIVNASSLFRSEPGADSLLRLAVDLDHAAMLHRDLPYPIRNLTGKVIFAGGTLTFQNVRGDAKRGSITLNGSLRPATDDSPMSGRIDVRLVNVEIDDDLRKALPPDVATVVQELGIKGLVNADLRVEIVDGQVRLLNDSKASVRNVVISDVPLPDASFDIRLDDKSLTIANYSGSYFGGRIQGNIGYKFEGEAFDVKLEIGDVDIKKFNERKPLFDEDIQGLLSGSVTLRGKGTDTNALTGRANINVRNGQLARIKVFADLIMSLFNLRWPGRDTITNAELRCSISEGEIKFREITLTGTTVPITGEGSLWLDGRLDMNFFTSNSDKEGFLRQIPLIGSVYGIIDDHLLMRVKNLIIQVQVKGTVQKPEASAVPFRAILAPVESLLKLIGG